MTPGSVRADPRTGNAARTRCFLCARDYMNLTHGLTDTFVLAKAPTLVDQTRPIVASHQGYVMRRARELRGLRGPAPGARRRIFVPGPDGGDPRPVRLERVPTTAPMRPRSGSWDLGHVEDVAQSAVTPDSSGPGLLTVTSPTGGRRRPRGSATRRRFMRARQGVATREADRLRKSVGRAPWSRTTRRRPYWRPREWVRGDRSLV